MTDPLRVREVNRDTIDPTSLSALAARTFPDACPAWLSSEEIRAFVAENLSTHQFARWLSDPDAHVLVAEQPHGGLVAYAVSVHGRHTEAPPRWAAARTAYLSKLYVEAGHRGGLGTRLLRLAEATALADGCDALWLGVNDENARAIAFYARSGLQKVGTRTFPVGGRLCSDELRGRPLP